MGFFDCLPAYELNRSPRIIAAFEMDFLRNLESFKKSIPQGEKFTMLLQLGWSVELPEVAASEAEYEINAEVSEVPTLNVTPESADKEAETEVPTLNV